MLLSKRRNLRGHDLHIFILLFHFPALGELNFTKGKFWVDGELSNDALVPTDDTAYQSISTC